MPTQSPNKENIANALRHSFGKGRVLVLGDIMLDRYLWGTVDRVSPEAPAPILRERRQSTRAGGAGNVALNLAGLGLQVSIAGFVGNDENRYRLLEIFERRDIDTSAVVMLTDRPTTTKTRVIAGHQHVLRLDAEELSEIRSDDREALSKAVMGALETDAIIMSDYAKGAVSSSLCQQVIEAARQSSTPVLVTPKGADFSKYASARVLTSNLSELSRASGISVADADDLVEAARTFVDTLGLQFLVLTRGADGMTLVAHDQTLRSPARAREVFDVSGAGDTVIAVITAAMIGGLDYVDMLHLGNLAAGVVVGRIGAVAIDQATLLRALHDEERASAEILQSVDDLLPLVELWRSGNQKIVYTQGLFNGVHADDVHFLHSAAREGDKLVVGVTSYDSANASGGRSRSIDDQLDRASVIASLTPVDAVVLCDAKRPTELIDILQPEVVVKGEEKL